MSLEKEIREVLDNFENVSTEKILGILNQIKPQFQNQLISEYLQGKIQKVIDLPDEAQKKKQCKALTPYLDWYLQGL
ncbi:MAG: hypothetical protein HRU07_08425 [Nitrosopumilus sp.]|nr:hypothetical protein [Nitrosopumilus sp.]NRA06159.1 hypothetical protein [Nitrosopumilus sp.]